MANRPTDKGLSCATVSPQSPHNHASKHIMINTLQDKVNISVAIIEMAKEFNWNQSTSGIVQSSFFAGYMMTQIPGGYVVGRLGGRRVLPSGVTVWSAATAATPLLAGTLPGDLLIEFLAASRSPSHRIVQRRSFCPILLYMQSRMQ